MSSVTAVPPVPPLPLTQAQRRAVWLPYAALGTVLLLWGFGPPLSKLITGSPLTISFCRLWTSALTMVVVQYLMGARPTAKAIRGGFLGGLAFGANSIVFFIALRHASIATLTVIGSLQPGLVMLGASQFFGERLTRWGVAWTAVAIGGAGIAVLGAGAAVHTDLLGVLCSAGSLIAMTGYFLASKAARKTLGAGEYIMAVMFWAAICATPVIILGGGLGHFNTLGRGDWFWMFIMLVGPGLTGQVLMGWAVKYVPVSLSSMILLGSTVVSIAAAWPIHGETLAPLQFLGGGIALGGVGAVVSRRS